MTDIRLSGICFLGSAGSIFMAAVTRARLSSGVMATLRGGPTTLVGAAISATSLGGYVFRSITDTVSAAGFGTTVPTPSISTTLLSLAERASCASPVTADSSRGNTSRGSSTRRIIAASWRTGMDRPILVDLPAGEQGGYHRAMDAPWEHPDWYDLHDTTWTAGPEREPEHYREAVIALPPLDRDDHLVDLGAGTGKLAGLIARSYPGLGRLTLVEPNARKLARAVARLREALPLAEVAGVPGGLGEGRRSTCTRRRVATVGSVFMPVMELRGGSLADALRWLRDRSARSTRCSARWLALRPRDARRTLGPRRAR